MAETIVWGPDIIINGNASSGLTGWVASNAKVATGGSSGNVMFSIGPKAGSLKQTYTTTSSEPVRNFRIAYDYHLTARDDMEAYIVLTMAFSDGTTLPYRLPLNGSYDKTVAGVIDGATVYWNRRTTDIAVPIEGEEVTLKSIKVEIYTLSSLTSPLYIDYISLRPEKIYSDAELADGSVTEDKLAAGAVSSSKLQELSVATAHIQDLAVTSAQIADAAITTAKIDDASITNAKIGQAAIGEANIIDASITNAKIDNLAVTNAKIADAAINNAKIDNAAITTAKIEDAAITTAKIDNAAITNAKIDNAAIDTAKIKDASITNAKIDRASVDKLVVATADIADAAITNAKIDRASVNKLVVGTADIADAAISTAKIGDLQVSNAKISNAAISSAKIEDLAVTAAKIDNAAIETAKIKDAAITNAKIDRASVNKLVVDTADIANAAITTAKIADAQISSAKIGDLAVTNGKIDNAAITTAKIADAQITDAKIDRVSANKLVVKTADIGDAQITTAKIGNLQVSEAKIANGAITSAKIDDAAITSAKIGDLQVTTGKIATGAITTALIDNGAITTAKIGDAQITSAKINDLNAGKINAGTLNTTLVRIQGTNGKLVMAGNRLQVFDAQTTPVERVSIGDVNNDGTTYGLRVRGADGKTVLYDQNGVYNEGITDGAVTNPKIGTDAVDGRIIAANAVTADHILAGTITADEIAGKTITAAKMVAGTITAASGIIADAAITTAKIADLQVTGAKMANATITTAKIGDLQVTTGKIADLAVDAAKIANATITTAKIGDSQITTAKIGDAQITNAKVANLDASKITTGTLDAARIKVGSSSSFENGYDPTKIEIGGRNLILNTDRFIQKAATPGNANTGFALTDSSPSTYQSRPITISVEYELFEDVTQSTDHVSHRFGIEMSVLYTDGTYAYVGAWQQVPSSGVTKRKGVLTATLTLTKEIKSLNNPGIYIQGVAGALKLGRPKLELGNKRTDWSPAPEDILIDAKAYRNLWAYKDTTYIDGGNIYTNSVTTNQIAANSITAASGILADLAVTTAKIENLAITEGKIANLAVTNGKIANLAVTTAKIGDSQITTAKIGDLQVSTGKIANLAVAEGKIANLAVTEGKIANLAVTTAKINDAAITTAKIGDAQITNAKIASLSADKINAGTITGIAINNASGTFSVTSAGYLTASSGKIAGWSLTGSAIYRVSSAWGNSTAKAMYLGDNGISVNNKFKVNAAGELTATNANISGFIDSAIISGSTISSEGGSGSINIQDGQLTADVGGYGKRLTLGATLLELSNYSSAGMPLVTTQIRNDAINLMNNGTSPGREVVLNYFGIKATGTDSQQLQITGSPIYMSSKVEIRVADVEPNNDQGLRITVSSGDALQMDNNEIICKTSTGDLNTLYFKGKQFQFEGPIYAPSGNMIRSGNVRMNGANTLENISTTDQLYLYSPYRVGIGGDTARFYFGSDSVGPRVWSSDIYSRTYSGSANMQITSSGTFGRITSARKYKLQIEESRIADPEAILKIAPQTWYDKSATEAVAALLTKEAHGEQVDWDSEDIPELRRIPGLIAEDVEAVGLSDYVIYETKPDGTREVEGLMYERLWTMLIPVAKKQKEEIEDLRVEKAKLSAQIASYEERLAKLEKMLLA